MLVDKLMRVQPQIPNVAVIHSGPKLSDCAIDDLWVRGQAEGCTYELQACSNAPLEQPVCPCEA
eukprot:7084186-Alexandrium_andersonii.AAC.1